MNLKFLVLVMLVSPIQSQRFYNQRGFREAIENHKRIPQIELLKTTTKFTSSLLELWKSNMGDFAQNTSHECNNSLNSNASKSHLINYVDALGKPGAGIFGGNLLWYGSYEECLTISEAHYCAMKNIKLLNSTVPLSLFGVCIPRTCDVNDVTQMLRMLSRMVNSRLNSSVMTVSSDALGFLPAPSQCYDQHQSYTSGAIGMIVVTAILLFLSFIGTTTHMLQDIFESQQSAPYVKEKLDEHEQITKDTTTPTNTEINYHRKEPLYVKFLLCFSLIKNSKAVLDTKIPRGSITSINGIRTLSIMWVILGHVILFAFQSDNAGVLVNSWVKRFSFQAITNAVVSVDTFFVLSGLLVGYLSFRRFETHGKLPLFRFYVHRYIRLTVSYAYLIFFVTYLYRYLHHGPTWDNNEESVCKDYWWTNLLYINNFYPVMDQGFPCYGVSWYLANDMQFYVISPLILWCMYKWKSVGVLVSGSVVIAEFLLANGLLIDLEDASPVLDLGTTNLLANPQTANYQKYIYQKPYTRIAPYVIGIILGYILFYKKTISSRLPTTLLYVCGWLVAVGTGLAVVYGPYTSVYGHHWVYSERVIYGMFFRIAWTIAVCWVIYACHHGYGSLIDNFLSWKAFIPLSRLTFGAYLIHWYVASFFFQTLQTPFHITEITLSFVFIAVTFISYFLAFFVAILIDYPVANLEKLLLNF